MRGHVNTIARSNRRRLLAVALSLFLGQTAEGQTAELPTFTEAVEVRVVNLEVVVTEGGKRKSGLRAEDFELRVDGKSVPIDFFTEVTDGRAVNHEGTPPIPSLAAGQPVGTSYLVFIDDYFAVPNRRDQALKALRDHVSDLSGADTMAVVAYDGRRIDLLTGWTRSPEELTAAFEEAMKRTAYGLRRMSEIRRLGAGETSPYRMERYKSGRSSFSSIGFQGAGRGPAVAELQPGYEITARISQVVRAAAATLRGFAQPAQRQVMLLLSGGWPAMDAANLGRLAGDGREGASLTASPAERFHVFKPLVDTANRLGYTLYPVDLTSEAGYPSSSAEFSSSAAARFEASRRSLLATDSREALIMLAEATGGRSFEGASRRGAFKQAVEDTRSYYWLGFSPDWRGDDETHRIEVRPRRKGLKVRARKEFTDLSRRNEIDLMVEGAQLFDRPLPGEGELDAELGEASRAGRGRVLVPLKLTIPLDKLTLLPGSKGYSAALELRVTARDEDGLVADVPLLPFEVARDKAPGTGDEEIYEIELKLRQKSHRLVVALYEPATGNLLSKRLELKL